jgi:hypothetical protein
MRFAPAATVARLTAFGESGQHRGIVDAEVNLRDLSVASIELPLGLMLMAGGAAFGVQHWLESAAVGEATTAGQVMLSALPILVGLQLFLAFINFDIASVPRRPLSRRWPHSAS